MRRPATSTWVMLAVAAACVALAHADPWADDGPEAELVSTKSNARRLLPELADLDETGATIELRPVSGDVVRIVADGAGHRVEAGGRVLGPGDPEAIGGLWASLRMGTTLRAVDDDDGAIAAGSAGTITVWLPGPDAAPLELWIGDTAPDGAGRYGGRRRAPRGVEGTWVVEEELGTLLDQTGLAWLAHRALVVEPAEIVAVAFDDGLVLSRGEDATWRSTLAGTTAMLERTAVEYRLQRLVSARMDPWVDADVDTSGTPWVAVTTADGRTPQLWKGGPCPGRPGRITVARGPGLRGCIDDALVQPWPTPGRGTADDGSMLDADLVVPEYGRVLRIALAQPGEPPRTLARHGGGWRIEQELAGQEVATEVDESEVYRWFTAAQATEVALGDAPSEDAAGAVTWTMALDSGTSTTLSCVGEGEAMRCRRDDGPWLQVRSRPPVLAFAPDTFVDRRLADASVDDVRAVEILPGPGGTTVRQSAHFDLGVWRLDAPLHPAGDVALAEDTLQALMAAAASVRADAWLDPTDTAPDRIVRLELTPQRDEASTLEVAVWPDCRVEIAGRRPARVSEGTCESLRADLLRTDTAGFLLLGARTVELTHGGETVRLVDDEGALIREDGAPLGEAAGIIDALRRFRATSVVAGPPPGEPTIRAHVRPIRGPAYDLTATETWVRIDDADWYSPGTHPTED